MVVRTSLPDPWGGILTLGIFLSVWANDSFAYLVGRKFGKHKLAPRTSPKKSWEGFVAGLAASMLFWFGLSFIPGVEMSVAQSLLFGLVCGLMGVLGDSGGKPHKAQFRLQGLRHHHAWPRGASRPLRLAVSGGRHLGHPVGGGRLHSGCAPLVLIGRPKGRMDDGQCLG